MTRRSFTASARLLFARVVLSQIVLIATACLSLTQPTGPGPVLVRSVNFQGIDYVYFVYVPTNFVANVPHPAMLLVHGAGGNGREFIDHWSALAESQGLLLVAPTLDLSAEAETKVPQVFPGIMAAVSAEWNVDASRRYVFGYSAGGYFAYDAALLSSDYFAGCAVFASVIQPDYDDIVQRSPRKTSIAIYLGTHDQYFSLEQGRRTRDLLLSAGMDVHYVELPGHDHDYSAVQSTVNDDAWAWLSTRHL